MAKLVYTYKSTELLRCNNATRYPDIGETVTVEGIGYEVTAVHGSNYDTEALVYLRLARPLHRLPTSLPTYLRMLHSFTEAQYDAWFYSLSYADTCYYHDNWLITTSPTTAKGQLEAYQCSLDCGTLVYYSNEKWEAYNADYLASATASTLAELLNYWVEATEHVRYDLP